MISGVPKQYQAQIAQMERASEFRRIVDSLKPGWPWWYQQTVGNGAPTGPQARFLASQARVKAFCGSFGAGKTQVCLWDLTEAAKLYPGIQMAAGRRYGTEVEEHMLPKARKYWAELERRTGFGATIKQGKGSCWVADFGNESKIQLRGFDDPDSFQGAEWNKVWVDEASQIDEESFKQIKARMRGASMGEDDPARGYPIQMLFTSNYATGWVHEMIAAPAMRGTLAEDFKGAEFFEGGTYDLEPKYEADARARAIAAGRDPEVEPSYIDDLRAGGLTEAELRGYKSPSGLVWPMPRDKDSKEGRRTLITTDECVRVYGGYDPRGDKGVAAGGPGTVDRAFIGMDHGIEDPSAISTGLVRRRPGAPWDEGKSANVLVIGALGEFYEPLKMRPHTFLGEVIAQMLGVAVLRGPGGVLLRMKFPPHIVSCDPRMKHGNKQQGVVNTAEHPSVSLRRMGLAMEPSPLTGPYQRAPRYHLVRTGIANGKIVFVEEGTRMLRREMLELMKGGKDREVREDLSLPPRTGVKDHMTDSVSYLVAWVAKLGLVDFGVQIDDWGTIDGEAAPGAGMGMADAQAAFEGSGRRHGWDAKRDYGNGVQWKDGLPVVSAGNVFDMEAALGGEVAREGWDAGETERRGVPVASRNWWGGQFRVDRIA